MTDLAGGVALEDLADGGLCVGKLGDQDVLLIRRGESCFAIGAACTHYHAALADGLLAGDTIRCPWHHACFDIRSGAALHAPALDALPRWRVERQGNRVFVRERLPEAARPQRIAPPVPTPATGGAAGSLESVLIIGGGAAGLAAALTLRREGYANALRLISADDSAPYDRPNLSKDFLAGTAPPEWMPLRSPQFYAQYGIELLLDSPVAALDAGARRVTLADGRHFGFDALLLATGAQPVRLAIPGAAEAQVCYLRSFSDARLLAARAANARRAVVAGASFIGLEVAASLRARGLEVHVIGLEAVPMQRVLGEQLGHFVQALHVSHGVSFHLGTRIAQLQGQRVTLQDGTVLQADLVVAGVGVRPAVALAQAAGIAVDGGVIVDPYLRTSAPGVFAAGDIASWPDAISGERIRVEHWVLAQRQGQCAARNMLGLGERFVAAPFFWSQHYDVAINMVGHAARWDSIQSEGSPEARDCILRYRRGARTLAVATIGRDRDSLEAELTLESTAQ
jgi:apoptosis-inducing factor 3